MIDKRIQSIQELYDLGYEVHINTTTNDPNAGSVDPEQAVQDALKEKKKLAFDLLLHKIFFFSSDANGPLPQRLIAYASVDNDSKTILIPKETPKDFFSLRRGTAISKIRDLIKSYYQANRQTTPQLNSLDEKDIEEMIYSRIMAVQLTTESPILKYQPLDEKELKNRMTILRNKADKLNTAMTQYTFLRNSFLSLAKGFCADIEEINSKNPGNPEISEFFASIKALIDSNLPTFSETDYVK
jgi:hypothetical protein